MSGPIGALIAAAISTFGIYFIASFLYVRIRSLGFCSLSTNAPIQRDPWHMFTSFLQYLCLAPSFTNVLNVYAFCNLHDVSWGTKGSDKAEALPSVSSKKGKTEEAVVEEATRNKEDLDAHFKDTVTRALTKLEVKEVIEKPTMDDQNRTFRTRLVAFWMLTNAGLAVAIENINGLPSNDEAKDEAALHAKQNVYFQIILWSTFGLAAVRFAGVRGFICILLNSCSPGVLLSACGTSSSATCSDSAGGTKSRMDGLACFHSSPVFFRIGIPCIGTF